MKSKLMACIVATMYFWSWTGAKAQSTVPLIVPYAPGGAIGSIAEELKPHLSKILESTVIIEFKPGGQGMIGTQALMSNKSPSMSLMIAQFLPDSPVDQLRDIIPVLDLGIAPITLISRPSLEINNMAQLVRLPGRYTIGYVNGSAQLHWLREFAKNHPNITLIEVPYKSGAAVLADVAGGHIDLGISGAIGSRSWVQENKIKALATLGSKRSSMLPHITTPREQGVRYANDHTGLVHVFIWASPGTHPESIQRLKNGFQRWANTSQAQDLFKRLDLSTNLQTTIAPDIALRTYLNQ